VTSGSRLRIFVFAWFVVGVAVVAQVRGAGGKGVSFRADDGRTINAVLFEADQHPAPAVVLVPMLGRSKDDWQAVGQKLSEAGVTALAIDLPAQTLPGDSREISWWPTDVRAAVGFLAARPEVRPGSVGVAGASLGASIAALAAVGDSRVRALALISPALDYRGVRIENAMRQYGARPALLLASAHDPYAARSAKDLAGKDAPGPREVHLSEVSAHGTLLLAQDAELVRILVEWFRHTLG
jgi:alpha-beta hydrolase superfamily lysophospholipase